MIVHLIHCFWALDTLAMLEVGTWMASAKVLDHPGSDERKPVGGGDLTADCGNWPAEADGAAVEV